MVFKCLWSQQFENSLPSMYVFAPTDLHGSWTSSLWERVWHCSWLDLIFQWTGLGREWCLRRHDDKPWGGKGVGGGAGCWELSHHREEGVWPLESNPELRPECPGGMVFWVCGRSSHWNWSHWTLRQHVCILEGKGLMWTSGKRLQCSQAAWLWNLIWPAPNRSISPEHLLEPRQESLVLTGMLQCQRCKAPLTTRGLCQGQAESSRLCAGTLVEAWRPGTEELQPA